MRASIVIPTFNRLADLRRVLDAVARMHRPPRTEVEVVVVDDGSSDGTREWLAAASMSGLRALTQANAGPATARNRGVTAASGDIVLFLGDDTVPDDGWLLEHLESHRLSGGHAEVAVLGYTSFPAEQDSAFLRFINEFGPQFGYLLIEDAADVPFNFFYTSNISLPRSTFLARGGFREDFPAAAWEDIEFAYRAARDGLRIIYQPRARTVHHHCIRPGSFHRRQHTAGRSAAIFAELHPELAHFLGVHRHRRDRAGGAPVRAVLLALMWAGDLVPGLVPDRLYRRYLDMSYLQGLAEGLLRRSV